MAQGALSHSGVAHTPGNLRLTLSWVGMSAPGSSVTFTPVAPFGTFSPPTVTLTSSGSSTGLTTLTVPGGESFGSGYVINVTNGGGVAVAHIP